ncbi:MAG: winged helix-turn-helix domain-containing protein [Candidatus Omnitrophica bacterium]|nr:winged helix-turn-helix domain-containing protein [Candidatus Omnitrophota bacterium]MBU1127496.1 winged helix-turn-helix domain-containing protein [Candidatus Omnitrophota bacterium]MBU1785120.1 winged helix-turn-helix domain-containing protein [Candidatus Omnitrophota bacterium]MBU1851513.1 winged helix-turn-helix domain-containing protein [Candidatus Omnitrophota bacterium]
MITKIGLVAGDVLNYLDGHGGVDQIENIVAGVEKEDDIVFMSIGWLAREGLVVLERKDGGYTVELSRIE